MTAGGKGLPVVVHLPDPATLDHAVRNVLNLRTDLGPDVVIEVVVHGPGVARLAASSPAAADVAAMVDAGIQVDACANSLRSLHLEAAGLAAGVTVVSSGVGHVVRLQRAGYAYLRL